ncbi:hypothetical protein [Bradyrhizobium sp. SSUT77]|uniref:hypothetical protein n=1 Tax=Bradyrhizobium sp. SSUT77 TaxID=3040603 RepID=UPI00244C6152|nr:hypothetical protein [Bradyrhizobium sp. SSUT77]MDH2348313.1 hypothetical protein [Bradyrhizobium sp. SSUT77]
MKEPYEPGHPQPEHDQPEWEALEQVHGAGAFWPNSADSFCNSCYVDLAAIAPGPKLSIQTRGNIDALMLPDACEDLSYRSRFNGFMRPSGHPFTGPSRKYEPVSASGLSTLLH